MKAIEAKQIAESSLNEKDLNNVLKKIREQAECGDHLLIIAGISKAMKRALENLGYQVELSSGGYADKVSWW